MLLLYVCYRRKKGILVHTRDVRFKHWRSGKDAEKRPFATSVPGPMTLNATDRAEMVHTPSILPVSQPFSLSRPLSTSIRSLTSRRFLGPLGLNPPTPPMTAKTDFRNALFPGKLPSPRRSSLCSLQPLVDQDDTNEGAAAIKREEPVDGPLPSSRATSTQKSDRNNSQREVT